MSLTRFRDWGIGLQTWRAYFAAWPAERWIALSSVVIALCALGTSIHQGYAIRHHQHLSVMPWLGLGFYYNEEGSGWILDRSGAGPALLQTFEVFVDKIAQPHWLAAGAALRLPTPPNFQFSVPRSGTLLMPGAADKIFWIAPGPGAEALQREANRLAIVACYCSLYEQCWRITNREGREEVRTCRPLGPIRFDAPPRPAIVSGTPSTSTRPGP